MTDLIALAGAFVPVILAGLGVVVVLAKNVQKVGDQGEKIAEIENDMDTLRADVARAQDAAMKVGGLAAAVEHMGQRFADRIENLVEVMTLNNENVKVQLNEIKDELKSVRSRRGAN